MRIDSGLQGYYYDQSRFKAADTETDEAPAAAAAPVRFSETTVESSTLLSSSLSNALWAIEGGRSASDVATPTSDADKIQALYLEYSDDDI